MYTVFLKIGVTLLVKDFDGGGCFLGGDYEVHCIGEDDESLVIPQKDIREVRDEEGEPFMEWGNKFFPGHPHYDSRAIDWIEGKRDHLY